MADKESEAAASAHSNGAAHQQTKQQQAASYFGPSLVNKQTSAVLASEKAVLDSQPSGYYQNVTQKAKLILPTAIWILIVVAGLCFLGLLSSLNKTINTLDTLVELELEQAKAKLPQAAEHGSLPSSHHHRHHHDPAMATAAANSAEAPVPERSLSQSAQDAPANSHTAKRIGSLSVPSWTSLERERKSGKASGNTPTAGADSLETLLGDMIQAASGEDKFVPVEGSIIIASSSSANGQDLAAPSAESMIDSLFGKFLGGSGDDDDGNNRPERLSKVDQPASKDSKAGSLITANIDRININVNLPLGQQQASQQREDEVPFLVRPLSMQMMPDEFIGANDNGRPELEKSLEELLGAIVDPNGSSSRYQSNQETISGDQGGLFMPLLPSPQAAPHQLLSHHKFRAPGPHRASHHHHQHKHHLPALAPPLSPLLSILLGAPPTLDQLSSFDQQQPAGSPPMSFVIAFDDDNNNDQAEAKQQQLHPSEPVNSPYEFIASSSPDFLNSDQMILPFFGSSGKHSAKRHQKHYHLAQKEDDENPSAGSNDFGVQVIGDELANQLIKSLFSTQETSEQNDQNNSNTKNDDHSDDEIVIFGADIPYIKDKKQSLGSDELGAIDDRKQVSDLFDLLFDQQANSKSIVEPQIVEPQIKLGESVKTQTEAPSTMQVSILPFDGTQRPSSFASFSSPSAVEVTSVSIGPHGQSSSTKITKTSKSADQQAPVDAQDVSRQQEMAADFQARKSVENLVSDLLGSMISLPQFGEEREPMRAEAQSSGNGGSKEQQVLPPPTTPMPKVSTSTFENANITVPVSIRASTPSTTTITPVPTRKTTSSSLLTIDELKPTLSTANETIAATTVETTGTTSTTRSSANTTEQPAVIVLQQELITSKPATMSLALIDKLTTETPPISKSSEADKKSLVAMFSTVKQPEEVDVKQQSTTQLFQSTPSPLSSSRSDQTNTITATVTPLPPTTTPTSTPTPITTTMTPAQTASPVTRLVPKDNGGRSDKGDELKKTTQAPAPATVTSNTSTTPTEPPPPSDSTSKPFKAFLKKADEFIEKNLFNFRRFLV